jgi:23S rRNA pseudouridine2457 synthase
MRDLLFNKSYGVLSQFTDEGGGHPTLKQYIDVPEVYAAGRLDWDSEGLLLLTDDGSLIKGLTDPKHHIEKDYRVLLPRRPEHNQLDAWQRDVMLGDGNNTQPVDVWFERTRDGIRRGSGYGHGALIPLS